MLSSMSAWQPWQIVISTILSARSKDETTLPVCIELFRRYPTVDDLADASPRDVERLIKKIGFYRNKTRFIIDTAGMIRERGVPKNMEGLLKFPGVGRKVANCVLVYAFGIPAIPVDTHVHRISNRLGILATKSPLQTEKELMRLLRREHWLLYNDLLVFHGKTVCRPIGPKCRECLINRFCRKVGVDKKYYA